MPRSTQKTIQRSVGCEIDAEEFKILKFYARKVGCPVSQLFRGIVRDVLLQLEVKPYKPDRLEILQTLSVLGQDVLFNRDETVKESVSDVATRCLAITDAFCSNVKTVVTNVNESASILSTSAINK